MIEGITDGHPGSVIHSVVAQSFTELNIIFGFDAVAEQEAEKIEELHLHVEREAQSVTTDFFETKSMFRLKYKY